MTPGHESVAVTLAAGGTKPHSAVVDRGTPCRAGAMLSTTVSVCVCDQGTPHASSTDHVRFSS